MQALLWALCTKLSSKRSFINSVEEPFSVTRSIFEGAPLDAVFTIELCAGCARLSASLSAKGFRAMAVDQKSNKHQQAYATIALDLESDEAVHYLLSLLKQPGRVLYVHAAPLCGTCARTRERKLKRALRKLGVKEPQALRSAQFPHGLPGLKGTNLKRVLLAIFMPISPKLWSMQSLQVPTFPLRTPLDHGCGTQSGCETSARNMPCLPSPFSSACIAAKKIHGTYQFSMAPPT